MRKDQAVVRKRIPINFFEQKTLSAAKNLLGTFLVRKQNGREIAAMITDVEAYVGQKDLASHASRGRTSRTEVMFGEAGRWYVYLVYGIHYCLNIVTEKSGYPAAILIRGVEGVEGPGRVCKYFGIDKRFNTFPATHKTGLWIENRGVRIRLKNIKRGSRIGVDYAGVWKEKKWRFFLT